MALELAAALPEDVLTEVLRRLSPHVLAASRWVCRAWRDVIDARLRHLLFSHSVSGIFINYTARTHGFSKFFSRPSMGPAIHGGLDFLLCDGVKVTDHYVVNPATRRWARLPRRRPQPHMTGFGQSACLAFEPAVSPHYEVFLIPCLPGDGESNDEEDALLRSEWPPASYSLHVFSSMADRWDERTFLLEGEATGIVAHTYLDLRYQHAVYWRSNLYIHSQHGCYLTRMSSTNHTYRVIRLPGDDDVRQGGYPYCHLGRSLGGIYCAQNKYWNKLLLWHLSEPSRDQTEWVLKHDIDLAAFAHNFHALNYRQMFFEEDHTQQVGGPWILQDVKDFQNFEELWTFDEDSMGSWNSEEHNILDIDDAFERNYGGGGHHFLGFHPYKEIVYLEFPIGRGVAYDWNSSKFHDLGNLKPQGYHYLQLGTDASFPYTPCWMGQFPGNELETQLKYEELLTKKLELEAQLESSSNFTCVDEYELHKHRGHAKRIKDCAAKTRRRRRIVAR
ncbi:putative F-box/kelch-repeat protein At1g15680 [Lolium rigidum]|uniref:putative F-box/kelch-repeat protein At1g15680 n=1 Tax=Lolium rigidum TaxID=89674 RepID=UPI001F5E0F34|nr:putative F-box/kelch-repeat protein At1g15680 [Lolium rigidum]